MNKAYKIRLYPDSTQVEQLIADMYGCRFIYNEMLAERKNKYKQAKKQGLDLKSIKTRTEKQIKEEFKWLKKVNSRALQQSRIDLTTAYKNFFVGIKKGHDIGFPKFKSRHKSSMVFREPQVYNQNKPSIRINNNHIKLLKVGMIKFRGLSKKFRGIIKSVTVRMTPSGKFEASILTEQSQIIKQRVDDQINGLDLGIKTFATLSSGEFYKNIVQHFNYLDKKIRKLSRSLSRKKKGSNRYKRARIKRAKIYKKLSNIRTHFHWHLVNQICSENQTIIIENLAVKNMIKNRKLSRSISMLGWTSFKEKLKHKALEYETKIVEADRFFPSSKMCSCCGAVNKNLTLKDRVYECECGFSIDRDLNAAINLRSLEYRDHGRGEAVRPREMNFHLAGSFVEASTLCYV